MKKILLHHLNPKQVESKNKVYAGRLFVVLLFLFMLLSMAYHICGNEFNPLLRKLLFNNMQNVLIIGLLVVVYLLTTIKVIKSLTLYSAIPYFVLRVVYICLLYFEILTTEQDIYFIIAFFLIFFFGLYKIKNISHDLTIEN